MQQKNRHLIPQIIEDLIVKASKDTPWVSGNEKRNAYERLLAIRDAINEVFGK